MSNVVNIYGPIGHGSTILMTTGQQNICRYILKHNNRCYDSQYVFNEYTFESVDTINHDNIAKFTLKYHKKSNNKLMFYLKYINNNVLRQNYNNEYQHQQYQNTNNGGVDICQTINHHLYLNVKIINDKAYPILSNNKIYFTTRWSYVDTTLNTPHLLSGHLSKWEIDFGGQQYELFFGDVSYVSVIPLLWYEQHGNAIDNTQQFYGLNTLLKKLNTCSKKDFMNNFKGYSNEYWAQHYSNVIYCSAQQRCTMCLNDLKKITKNNKPISENGSKSMLNDNLWSSEYCQVLLGVAPGGYSINGIIPTNTNEDSSNVNPNIITMTTTATASTTNIPTTRTSTTTTYNNDYLTLIAIISIFVVVMLLTFGITYKN